jgi:hypothetical protein
LICHTKILANVRAIRRSGEDSSNDSEITLALCYEEVAPRQRMLVFEKVLLLQRTVMVPEAGLEPARF